MPFTLLAMLMLLLTTATGVRADQAALPEPTLTLDLQPVERTAPSTVPGTPVPPAAPGTPALPLPPGNLDNPNPPGQPALHTIKAYYVGYAEDSFAALQRYIGSVDIVAGQWLSVDRSGQLAEAQSIEKNDQVRQMVHAAGKKVYTCVVNRDFANAVLAGILQSAERRGAVIDRIVAFVQRKGDDGIDLDFEGVRAAHRPGYSAFVKELAGKLHACGKELSLAVDVNWDGTPSAGYDYPVLGQFADSIMPMTYTFGPGRAPIGPIGYLENAARTGVQAMAAGKFMIGMGVYARNYDLRTGRRSQPTTATIQAILDRYHPQVALDSETLTKKFSYEDENGHSHVVFYDDPETVRAKLSRLSERWGVTSVGFWRMGQEDPSMWRALDLAMGRQRPEAEQTASAGPLPDGG